MGNVRSGPHLPACKVSGHSHYENLLKLHSFQGSSTHTVSLDSGGGKTRLNFKETGTSKVMRFAQSHTMHGHIETIRAAQGDLW